MSGSLERRLDRAEQRLDDLEPPALAWVPARIHVPGHDPNRDGSWRDPREPLLRIPDTDERHQRS